MNLNFTLVLETISFLLLLIVMTKLLYKPLVRYLDERARRIKDEEEAAEKQRSEAALNLQRSKEAFAKTTQKILSLSEEASKEVDEAKLRIISEAKAESRTLLEKTKRQIDDEIASAKKAARKDISEIAVGIAEKILKREIKEKDHKRLIEESLKGIAKSDK